MKFWIQKEVGIYNVEECNSIKLNSGFHNGHIFYRATKSDVLTEKKPIFSRIYRNPGIQSEQM